MTQRGYDLSGVKVRIAMPVMGQVTAQTVASLVSTAIKLNEHGVGQDLHMSVGCSIVELARNLCLESFLQSDATHLFWIDSDLSWQAEDFVKLLAMATELPCVLAAYPIKREPLAFFLRAELPMQTNEHGCFPVLSAGLGFTCVQRAVVEAMASLCPTCTTMLCPRPVPRICRCGVDESGSFCGEDYTFFDGVRTAGFQAWLEPNIVLGHVGPHEYKGALSQRLASSPAPEYENSPA